MKTILPFLFAAGAMLPVFCQDPQVERVGGNQLVRPGDPVCVLVTLSQPDKEIAAGGLTFASGGYTVGFGSASFFRASDTTIRLCHSLDANAPGGEYRLTALALSTSQGKRKDYHYGEEFKTQVTFVFENRERGLPSISDVKRVLQ